MDRDLLQRNLRASGDLAGLRRRTRPARLLVGLAALGLGVFAAAPAHGQPMHPTQSPVPVPPAQPSAPADPAPPSPPSGFVAIVVDGASGVPLAGAWVRVAAPSLPRPIQGLTDARGSFQAPDLGPGTYTVAVTRTGYASEQTYGEVRADHTGRVDIRLWPAGSDPPGPTVEELDQQEDARLRKLYEDWTTANEGTVEPVYTADYGGAAGAFVLAGTFTGLAAASAAWAQLDAKARQATVTACEESRAADPATAGLWGTPCEGGTSVTPLAIGVGVVAGAGAVAFVAVAINCLVMEPAFEEDSRVRAWDGSIDIDATGGTVTLVHRF